MSSVTYVTRKGTQHPIARREEKAKGRAEVRARVRTLRDPKATREPAKAKEEAPKEDAGHVEVIITRPSVQTKLPKPARPREHLMASVAQQMKTPH